MTTYTEANKTYVYKNHLFPLSKLSDFQVAKNYSDVTGWSIVGGDGDKLGKVNDLIVDVDQERVLYLDIDLDKNLFEGKEQYHILVPLGLAILNRDDKNVIVTSITTESLLTYPLYEREPVYVMRSYENAIRDYYNRGEEQVSRPTSRDVTYYNHEHFNDPQN